MKNAITVSALIEQLQALVAGGRVAPDSFVEIQGCDCTGAAHSLEVTTSVYSEPVWDDEHEFIVENVFHTEPRVFITRLSHTTGKQQEQ